MKKIIESIKRFIIAQKRKVAIKKATKEFLLAAKVAESRHKSTGKRIFVIESPLDEKQLLAITPAEHCAIRAQLGLTSKQVPIKEVLKGCWYYTANEKGNDRMDARDLVFRKQAFVHDRLKQKGLPGLFPEEKIEKDVRKSK